MVDGLDAPEEMPAPPAVRSRSRSPFGLGVFLSVFVLGALFATLALAAALSSLGLWAALTLGLLLAVGPPLFLTLRSSGALKRRGLPAVPRYLLVTLLSLLTHAALVGISLEWVGRSGGDMFLVAHTLMSRTVGEVPLLSGVLRRGAEEATVSFGGSASATASDAGPASSDGGLPGELASAPRDGGVLPGSDAAALSPRVERKRPVGAVVSLLRTERGGYGAIVTSLDAGGQTRSRSLDLTPFAVDGGAVAADAARDGSAAFVMGGGSVVYAGPDEGARVLPALTRGAKLPAARQSGGKASSARSLRAVRDVVIAPGGALLMVADVVVTSGSATDTGEVHAALLGYHPRAPGPALVHRISGAEVPGAAEGSFVTRYALRRSGSTGRVAVVESFLEGGEGGSERERLLAGRVDEGALLEEIARGGDAVVGLPQRALIRFEAASVLADGRVLFGAAFLEEGAGSSLFIGRAGQEPLALAAEAVRELRAPWRTSTPAAPQLVAEPDGRFAFLKPGEGIMVADVDRPLEAKLLPARVRVYQRAEDGREQALGQSRELFHPTLAQGGDWLVVGARLDDGRRALLLLSRADMSAGVAEALYLEQGPLPLDARASPKAGVKDTAQPLAELGSIRTLNLYQWRAERSNGTTP